MSSERLKLSASEIENLLNELSARLGFCSLDPDLRAQLFDNPPIIVDEFTDAVMHAEGLYPYKRCRKHVRAVVARYFQVAADREDLLRLARWNPDSMPAERNIIFGCLVCRSNCLWSRTGIRGSAWKT